MKSFTVCFKNPTPSRLPQQIADDRKAQILDPPSHRMVEIGSAITEDDGQIRIVLDSLPVLPMWGGHLYLLPIAAKP